MPSELFEQEHPDDRQQRIRQLVLERMQSRSNGDSRVDEAIAGEHPELMPELAIELAKLRSVRKALEQLDQPHDQQRGQRALDRLEADWSSDQRRDFSASTATSDGASDRSSFSLAVPDLLPTEEFVSRSIPEKISRYRLERLLGQGGFGSVFLAQDEELGRPVAVKIPHRQRIRSGKDIDLFLTEARVLASLDHPAILPVYDAGRTDDGGCFVVSKYLPGDNLADRIKHSRLPTAAAVRIVLEVARALEYAHSHGVVHRDVKPANILLDSQGAPFVVDFGLAIKEEDPALPARECFAGTPGYMSPEQARGEGHRVDGRSDLFSLGVVMYELLSGVRPFQAASHAQSLERIIWQEPRPLTQLNGSIPLELERICLKCLSKRAADRYANAAELVSDLQSFLEIDVPDRPDRVLSGPARGTGSGFVRGSSSPPREGSADAEARIVPKGLRAFDSNDADFFLELLPGPRDRFGLPESLRHWKHLIESCDPGDSFAVGVLYGPSGCGKSSFIQAGLVPRLAPHVEPLLVEAASDETEERLLRKLVNRYPSLASDSRLAGKLARIRRGEVLPRGQKLLLVIDQFEQWLHGRGDLERRELVEALRQCDGERLQCLLLVRDDFWLALSRFLGELEVDLVQGRNAALVDLFDRAHARKVLAQFGRAFGCLPENLVHLRSSEEMFLDGAMDALSDMDKVIPVRLALFAEMVKSRPWASATLRDLGGATGVGVAFLEETFDARSANSRNRMHERAARMVLESLLPEPGSAIKGAMRSYAELLDISGYGQKPREFKELMRILDAETRLLTPTDHEGGTNENTQDLPGTRYYQLTHDYLVPSLREWLTKKQRSTYRGRAELRLAERAQMWTTRRERRQLPSMWEWLIIRARTRPTQWTSTQQEMMQAAGRRHFAIAVTILLALLVFAAVGSDVSSWATDMLVRMRGRTANVWIALRQENAIWPLLRHSSDPTLRTQILHSINPLVVSSADLVATSLEQPDVTIRRAMILAAGEVVPQTDDWQTATETIRRSEAQRELVQTIVELYQGTPDAGLHAAAEWTLRRLRQHAEINKANFRLESAADTDERMWYRNDQGHVMVVLPGPTQFEMGSPQSASHRRANELFHTHRLARSFSIANKETTVAQFQQFLRDNPGIAFKNPQSFHATLYAPQVSVTWYQAAAYCNWLSKQSGLSPDQWCYQPNAAGEYDVGMKIAPQAFTLRGYRLPLESEWEYACRAGSATPWFFGTTDQYLDRYAWFQRNSLEELAPVGMFKPNDYGLFDMLGNAAEWCHDPYRDDARISASGRTEPESSAGVRESDLRVVRGGSFRDAAGALRSASRGSRSPSVAGDTVGFRVARSYP